MPSSSDASEFPGAYADLIPELNRIMLAKEVKENSVFSAFIVRLLTNFADIRDAMPLRFADDLANFVTTAVREMDEASLATIQDNKTFKELSEIDSKHCTIGYRDWFLLATAFGPDKHELQPYRAELTEYWGVDFPAGIITYPHVSVRQQKKHFYGIKDIKLVLLQSQRVEPQPQQPRVPKLEFSPSPFLQRQPSEAITSDETMADFACLRNQVKAKANELEVRMKLLESYQGDHQKMIPGLDACEHKMPGLKEEIDKVSITYTAFHWGDTQITPMHLKCLKQVCDTTEEIDGVLKYLILNLLHRRAYKRDDIETAYQAWGLVVPEWL